MTAHLAVAQAPVQTETHHRGTRLVLVGGLCGLTWAASLRGWMMQLAGPESTFSWIGTFAGLLIPGMVVGALLGLAEHLRRTGGRRGWRWLALAPLLFPVAALSLPGAITLLRTTGQGGGAIGMVALAMLAGASIAGRCRLWWRVPAFVLGFALVPAAYLGPPMRPELDPATHLGAWAATNLAALFITLSLACAIPHREVTHR